MKSTHVKFLEIEKKYELFKRNVLGINYWEYMRVRTYEELSKNCDGISAHFTLEKSLKQYLINFKELKKYILREKNVDVLVLTHPRRVKNSSNIYENVCTDEFEKIVSEYKKTLTIEEPTWGALTNANTNHLIPNGIENIYYTDFSEIRYRIKKMFFKNISKKKYSILKEEYVVIQKIFEDEFNVKFEFFDLFFEAVMRPYLMYKEVKKLIERLNPKILLFQYFPSSYKTLVVNICNEKNIPTVELQHGTITEEEPMSKKCMVPEQQKTVAKYIFAFGEKQVDQTNFSIKPQNIHYVGSYHIEREKNKKSDLDTENKKYILIISQSTIGDQMSDFASKLADVLKDDKEYKIIFKYHPKESAKDYECLKKENILEVKNNSSRNIYDYQRSAFCQIGVYSTALYEGLAMKVPTFVLKNFFHAEDTRKVLEYIKKGLYFVGSPEEIREILKNKIEKPLDSDVNLLWASKTKDEVRDLIDSISLKGKK